MEFLLAFSTFITVTLMAYGLMHNTAGNGAMDMRLGGLRYSRPSREALPDPDAAFSQRVIQPLIRGVFRRANGILPSTMEERLERGLTQAGMKIKPGQFLVMVGIAAGVLPTLATLYVAAMGGDLKMIVGAFGVMTAFGIYAPRIIVMGRIKRR